MNTFKRAIAAAELLLVFPAVLFMTALFVRNLQPLQYEPRARLNGSSRGIPSGRTSVYGFCSSPCPWPRS
jgi:hypothetical protein